MFKETGPELLKSSGNSCDSPTALWIQPMPLNATVKNGEDVYLFLSIKMRFEVISLFRAI